MPNLHNSNLARDLVQEGVRFDSAPVIPAQRHLSAVPDLDPIRLQDEALEADRAEWAAMGSFILDHYDATAIEKFGPAFARAYWNEVTQERPGDQR